MAEDKKGPYEFVVVRKENGVGELILSRPKKLNALSNAFFEEIVRAVEDLSQDKEVRVVLIWAEGKAFTAGLDIADSSSTLLEPLPHPPAAANFEMLEFIRKHQANLEKIRSSSKPFIAAIHGACIGAGVDLVTACDFRLCTQDVQFSVRETKMAIVADFGTLQRLPRIIGKGPAREMCFTGANYGSAWALRTGLVNYVDKTKEQMLEHARQIALEISENPAFVVQGTKRILNYSDEHSLQDGLEHVAMWNTSFLRSEDLQNAVLGFLEGKRPRSRL